MRRAALKREVTAAVLPRLGPGEDVVGAAAVWVTTPRGLTQRVFSARRLLPAVLTEQRLVLFRPPDKGKVASNAVALEIPLAHLRLDGVGRLPLLQVRLQAGRTREIVVEFRPRDRWLGRQLANRVRGGAARLPASASAAPAPRAKPDTGEAPTRPEPALPPSQPPRRRQPPDT
jgi:hypothetical protein